MSLGKGVLFQVCLRSLFLQAAWNREGMQGVGLTWALWPGLRAIHSSEAALEAAAKRHIGVFNTHPYMAALVIGAILRMEQDLAEQLEARQGRGERAGPAPQESLLRSFKLGVGGSYGAIGDGLFWGGLLPLALALGALGGYAFGPWVGGIVFLGVYNLGHGLARFGGVLMGYRRGPQVVVAVNGLQLPRLTRWLRRVALVGFGIVAAYLSLRLGGEEGQWVLAGASLAIAYGSWRYLRAGRSSLSLTFVVSGLAVLIGVLIQWGQGS